MARGIRADPDPSLLHAALLPLALVSLFSLLYAAQLPLRTAAVFTAPLLVLFFAAPFWAKSSVASFDRDVARLLAIDAVERLEARYSLALGMRLFAPGAVVSARRAMVAAERGRADEARHSYLRAIRGYEALELAPVSVRLGYAHACYRAGHDPEAVRVYRSVLVSDGPLPSVRRNLAHALIRASDDVPEALRLLHCERRGESRDEGLAELALVEALAQVRLGDREQAQSLAAAAGQCPTEIAAELRAELDAALSTARPTRRPGRRRSPP